MASLTQLSAFLSNALAIEPAAVEKCVRGLKAAGRIKGDTVAATEAADLLCACLCSDPQNATGSYHLPAVGGEQGYRLIEPKNLGFDPSNDVFGRIIESIIAAPQEFPRINRFDITGRGENLRASITFGQDSGLRVWFGYCLLQELLEARPPGVQASVSVDGETIYRVADFVAPRNAASMRLQSHLNAARIANTPPSTEATIH